MIVKVCGLTRPQDVAAAAGAGADVVGMITGVPSSPRSNPPERLAALLACAGRARGALLVRDMPLDALAALASRLRPAIVHLCGGEDAAFRAGFRQACPGPAVWQTVGVPLEDAAGGDWPARVAAALADPGLGTVVLDSARGGRSGGAGTAFPFRLAAARLGDLARRVVVAGGLHPGNVREALEALRPAGVDASSGLESAPGIKDPEKVAAFVRAARGIVPAGPAV